MNMKKKHYHKEGIKLSERFGKRIYEQPKMYGSFSKELKSVLYKEGYVASIGMHGVIKLIILL